MPRFNAPPPNGDSRRAIQQRAREATRPAAPEKKGCWPFSAQDILSANGGAEEGPSALADKPRQFSERG
ncbi:MAG: hypothetical protein M3R45_01945 [Pseudomonadota bacterium]|nr:hypothetical protein [Pseudomonadota bacterium]